MPYVELLRSRRLLIWWAAILASTLVITGISAITHHLNVVNTNADPIPLDPFTSVFVFASFILASFVVPGLHAERTTLALVWTRPIARDAIAWRYILVDLATIVAGGLLVIIVGFIQLAVIGILHGVSLQPDFGLLIALALGCMLMWYGLISLASVWFPERAGMIAGFSWLVFSAISAFASIPEVWPTVHMIATALNYLNPFAYWGDGVTGVTFSTSSASLATNSHHGAIIAPAYVRAIGAWAIGIASLFLTVRLWSTREI